MTTTLLDSPIPDAANDGPDGQDDGLKRVLRRGFMLLLIGVAGLLAWAAWAPIDEALAGHGALAVAGQRKAVQHPEGGVVASLAVAEGDDVRRGQVLATLDVSAQRAEGDSIARQRLALAASGERLRALLDGAAQLSFSTGLVQMAEALPGGQRSLDVQRALFASQRQGSGQERRELAARHAQLQAELHGRGEQLARQREQRALVESQLEQLQALARDGYYPKVRLLDAQRQAAAARQEESRASAELMRLREALVEASSTQGRRAGEVRRDWEAELIEGERQAAVLAARAAALAQQVAQSVIVAPASGKVVALAVHTVGGVVKAGETLMEIVPGDDALIVEARFALHAGEKLQPGRQADLRFTSMDQTRTPVLRGDVLTVSADRLEDSRSGEHYLLVRVAVPAAERERLATAGGGTLRAGLPVEVFVSLGERSVLSMLAKPLADRVRRGLAA